MPDGSAFDHGGVHEYDPATGVVIDAALGPLRGRTTLSNLTFGWTGADRGTELTMTYVVRGEGLGAFAEAVDGVMVEQFQRMVRYVEYGEG